MFEKLLHTTVPVDVLELQKSECTTTWGNTCLYFIYFPIFWVGCILDINLNSLINDINTCKVQSVTDEAMSYVIRVTDVPRLFRHTNRDYPREPCAYMKSIVITLTTLQNKNCKKLVLDHVVTQ